ncbi:MAG: hypothetical protein HOQ43_06680, partial [Glycomyces artemisiae]|nr:hypothetical protein [Glycomyces artemisiae]
MLTADIAPFFNPGSLGSLLAQHPAPTFARLKQAVWTVLSLDTGTAEQHHVRSGGSAGAGGTAATAGPGQHDPSTDQVDGDE